MKCISSGDHAGAATLLGLVAGNEPAGAWIELRYRMPDERHWGSKWFDVRDIRRAAIIAIELGQALNVYVGTAPRVRKRGSADDVERGWLISADADSDGALDALDAFRLPPTMRIASGGRTPSGRSKQHAHWQLDHALGRADLKTVKADLARSLGADRAIASPAGILRIPGTMNHKPQGGLVRVTALDPTFVYSVDRITAVLEQAPAAPVRTHISRWAVNGDAWRAAQDDPIRNLAPPIYFRRLAGVRIPDRGGTVSCCLPDHPDKTPSLRIYAEPWDGWYCFGCGRGGSAFELAAHLIGVPLPLRGQAFRAMRNYLGRVLSEEIRQNAVSAWARRAP